MSNPKQILNKLPLHLRLMVCGMDGASRDKFRFVLNDIENYYCSYLYNTLCERPNHKKGLKKNDTPNYYTPFTCKMNHQKKMKNRVINSLRDMMYFQKYIMSDKTLIQIVIHRKAKIFLKKMYLY